MLRSKDFTRHSRPVGVSGKTGWNAGCQNAEFQTSIMPAISASVAGERSARACSTGTGRPASGSTSRPSPSAQSGQRAPLAATDRQPSELGPVHLPVARRAGHPDRDRPRRVAAHDELAAVPHADQPLEQQARPAPLQHRRPSTPVHARGAGNRDRPVGNNSERDKAGPLLHQLQGRPVLPPRRPPAKPDLGRPDPPPRGTERSPPDDPW